MRTQTTSFFYAAVLLAFVGGCSQPSTPASDSLPVDAGTPAVAANANEASGGDGALADFKVEPADVHMCDGQDRVVSKVRWQVKDPSVTTVRIEVSGDSQSERKTFAAGGASGEAKTGDWVVQGVSFHLVDAASGKELAVHQVKGLPCK